MELVKDSWVDPELQEYFADVLYRLEWLHPEGGGEVYLFILFEHKSHPDAHTALQVLRYMTQQWHAHVKTGTLPLPFIIPLVMYHGETRWTYPLTFDSLFGKIPAGMQAYVPRFSYELLDLSLHSSREIVGSSLVRTAFAAMHSIFDPNLHDRLPEILKTLASGTPSEVKFLATIVRYFATASTLNESQLSAALNVSFPLQASTLMPTLAETWMQKGEQKGIQQGTHSGQLAVIIKLLAQKFGAAIEPAHQAKLEHLSLADLDRLTEEWPSIMTSDQLHQWLAQH